MLKSERPYIVSLVACALLMHASFLFAETLEREHTVEIVDLSHLSWSSGESFDLNGEWNVFWRELISPDTFVAATGHSSVAEKFPISSHWSRPDVPYEPLESQGYATFVSAYRVPSSLDSVYIKFPNIGSAHSLWANGNLVGSQGSVAKTRSEEVPYFRPVVYQVTPDDNGLLLLVIQISNFNYFDGGMIEAPKITDESGYQKLIYTSVITSVFIGAMLIAMGLYNLSMFAFKRDSYAALFFGLLCISVSLRSLLIDDRILYSVTDLSWETLQRLEHLFFYLAFPCFVSFFSRLFPSPASHRFSVYAWCTISPFIGMALISPVVVLTQYNVVFQLTIIIALAVCFVLYLRQFSHEDSDSIIFGISLSILAVSVVNDILKVNSVIDTINVAHFGVLAFCITQSIALQRSHFKNARLVSEMSEKMAQQNQALRKMDQIKNDFLTNTSHELRTPLHGIAGLAKTLLSNLEQQLDPLDKRKLSLIASTSKRLGLLVNDILDFSSIRHGKINIQPSIVSAESLFSGVVSTLDAMATQKGLYLHYQLSSDLSQIRVDDFRMQQILFNLVGNSIKYTEHGSISISAFRIEESLNIEIKDTGVGFSKHKDLDQFVAFDEHPRDTRYIQESNGLGLWICKQLVELHGGTITIESDHSSGSTVTLIFPNAVVQTEQEKTFALASEWVQQAIVEEQHTQSEPCNSDGPLVFAVDDEMINLELLASHLIPAGYRLKTFTSGASFLTALEHNIPDLVILDYMMPSMDGTEVCSAIRKQYSDTELPVMMLTFRQQVGDIVQALGAGANDYLIKPYHDKELLVRLKNLVAVRSIHRSEAENERLKSEIDAQQQHLMDRDRLAKLVDFADDAMIMVDRDLITQFANKSALLILGSKVCGQPLSQFASALSDKANEMFEASWIAVEPLEMTLTLNKEVPQTFLVSYRLLDQDNPFVIFNLSAVADSTEIISDQQTTNSAKDPDSISHTIESAYSEDLLGQLGLGGKYSAAQTGEMRIKENLAALHRETLNIWERHTGKSKSHLAEESGLWRVYLDGTTLKTRTYDKYLNIKTMPNRPRWRLVVRTANFVLSCCDVSDKEQSALEEMIEQVELTYV